MVAVHRHSYCPSRCTNLSMKKVFLYLYPFASNVLLWISPGLPFLLSSLQLVPQRAQMWVLVHTQSPGNSVRLGRQFAALGLSLHFWEELRPDHFRHTGFILSTSCAWSHPLRRPLKLLLRFNEKRMSRSISNVCCAWGIGTGESDVCHFWSRRALQIPSSNNFSLFS